MPAVSHETVIEQLKWRYAVKAFDPSKKIPTATWRKLEEATVLAPSSFGFQPWKFIVVENPEVRKQLLEHSYAQTKVVEASHLIVFAARTELTDADADRLIHRTAEVNGVTAASLDGFRKMLTGSISRQSPAQQSEYAAQQTFIALGVFLASAALLGIDACPMGGFDPAKYDEILGLGAQGYRSVVIATAGYRAADDKYAHAPKVRFLHDEVVEHVK
ncbi:NAD(P)H-dependent oxidoreductase [soil metagenome]